MGGALLQLVAYGAQDVYLTGNPQITLFKIVYRRHTNFSMECIELTLETAKPSGRPTLQILRNGDLATRAFLRVTLPALTPSNSAFTGNVAWVRRLGHAMIKSVEIQIGGSPIDKHYGVWFNIWYELTHPSSKERGYTEMIGDVDTLTTLQSSVAAGRVIYVPLQFWFCRHYGLALPLIALQYHDVRLNFEFEDLDKLYIFSRGTGSDTAPTFASLTYSSAGVLIDYIYLDSEERRRFAQVGHEYLIEQLQTPGEQNLPVAGSGSALVNQTFTLNFNHPCKEFIWAHKLGAYNGVGGTSTGWFLSYSNSDVWIGGWENAVQDAADSLADAMFIGVDASSPTPDPWTTGTPVFDVVTLTPGTDPISVITGADLANALASTLLQSTTIKFLCVNTSAWVAEDAYVAVLANPITLGAINLADALTDITCEVDCSIGPGVGAVTTTATVGSHTLSLVNLSVPLLAAFTSAFTDRRLAAKKGNDVHAIIPHNFGVSLDGTGNIVYSGNLVLNGHDRFATREGAYFNYVQPWVHHTRTPADGINVYSFALHPEQHQPTGTVNMSRIDNTKLNYKTSDPFRADATVYAPLIYTYDTTMWVFAINYNVLRIMSGMGGLAYSS